MLGRYTPNVTFTPELVGAEAKAPTSLKRIIFRVSFIMNFNSIAFYYSLFVTIQVSSLWKNTLFIGASNFPLTIFIYSSILLNNRTDEEMHFSSYS